MHIRNILTEYYTDWLLVFTKNRHFITLVFILDVVAELFLCSCLLGLLESVTDGLSMYVQEPLVIGRRGCTGRDLNKETLVADNGR